MIYTVTPNPGIDKEYTVKQLAHNRVLRASTIRQDCGGKGFNVSRMLSNLGSESCALGFAGGCSGDALLNALAELGIQSDLVRISGESRTNISIVTEQGSGHIKVNEPGPFVTEREVSWLMDKITGLARQNDWWVMSGSLPPGVPEDIFARIIQTVQTAGAYAVLDASGKSLELGCQAKPWLIKPNAIEAGQLSGLPHKTLQQLSALVPVIHQMGAQHIVISAGRQGALLSDGSNLWLSKPPLIKELNPTGAGDAMLAGLIHTIANGQTLDQALAYGVACGTAAAILPGTSMPSKEAVETLLNKVQLNLYKTE